MQETYSAANIFNNIKEHSKATRQIKKYPN